LGQALGETVSKTNFQAALEHYWQQSLIAQTQTQPLEAVSTPQIDWGEGVDVSSFYGRSLELSTLTEWIVTDRCRLIVVLGMGGMGKTTLSVKATHQILAASNPVFEFVIWRSLRNAPPLETLLAELVPFLSHHQSCLLLTSREKPAIVAAFEGTDLKVRSLPLKGSEPATKGILQAKAQKL
jgi:hypothetical protein